MPLQKVNDPYKHVSLIYAQLMRFVSYKWWARYIYFITKKKLNKNSGILEIASGNCSFAEHFSKQYPNYIASDISFNMLHNTGYKGNRVCCDMLKLPFRTRFDLVISAFDSINYLTSKKKIKVLFNEVADLLSDEGVFTFDAALERNSYKHQKAADNKGRINGYTYKRKSIYMPSVRIHKNIFYINYPDGTAVTEVHRQKIYSYNTFFELAENSGLYIVNCYKAFSIQRGNEKSDRVQFVMKRRK